MPLAVTTSPKCYDLAVTRTQITIALTTLLLPLVGGMYMGMLERIERWVRAMKPGPLRRILLLGRRH